MEAGVSIAAAINYSITLAVSRRAAADNKAEEGAAGMTDVEGKIAKLAVRRQLADFS